jgi:hypothetical protein
VIALDHTTVTALRAHRHRQRAEAAAGGLQSATIQNPYESDVHPIGGSEGRAT